MRTIRPVRVNHLNVVLEDFDESIARWDDVYGAEFLSDIPQQEWHAALIGIGRCIFELFVPSSFLLNARYGPHFLGIEYQADMTVVREVLKALADNGADVWLAREAKGAEARLRRREDMRP